MCVCVCGKGGEVSGRVGVGRALGAAYVRLDTAAPLT